MRRTYHVWKLSDESLLAGLGSGNPEAATAFVRRFQGRVFGLALTIVRDRDMAQEVAQEAFVRAWRHAAAYDPRRGGVATWLLTITRNLSLDVVRLRRPVPVDPESVLALQIPSPERGPDERLIAAGESERVRHALAGLPEDQRRALVLAAYMGLTAKEIGELDGVPLGTVKTRIRAAMMKLRSTLGVTSE